MLSHAHWRRKSARSSGSRCWWTIVLARGTNSGADLVAKAPADGHNYRMGAVATHAINPHLYRQLPYDPIRDFTPVTLITQVPNVLVVHPSLPVASVGI